MANNGTNKFTIDCPHCGQRFSIAVPKVERLNTPRSSIIVAAHEKPIKCICGGSSVIGIDNASISWAIVPISHEQASQLEGSSIVTLPEGTRLIG